MMRNGCTLNMTWIQYDRNHIIDYSDQPYFSEKPKEHI
jgi:hypothetical protein